MADSIATGVAYRDPTLNGAVIDNSVIGATTAAAGTFTTVTASGLGTFVGLKSTGSNLIASTSASTLGFFLSAGVAQVAMSAFAAVATTAAINSSISSSCFGFTSAQATNIILLVNALRAAGVSYGLWAT